MPKEKHMGATEEPRYVSLPLIPSKGPHLYPHVHVLLSYSSEAATLDKDKFQFNGFKYFYSNNHRFKN